MREQLPRLRTESDRAALLANLICEAFGNNMGVVTEESPEPPLQQLQSAFGNGPIPVGELVAAGLGGARSRAIAFKAIADGLPPQYRLRTRLVRAQYPQVLAHELQLHAWNDVVADGREYVVDLMDDAGALYEKVHPRRLGFSMWDYFSCCWQPWPPDLCPKPISSPACVTTLQSVLCEVIGEPIKRLA